jgi:hypothetical protein
MRKWIYTDFTNLIKQTTSLSDCDTAKDDMCVISSYLDENFLIAFGSPKLISFWDRDRNGRIL